MKKIIIFALSISVLALLFIVIQKNNNVDSNKVEIADFLISELVNAPNIDIQRDEELIFSLLSEYSDEATEESRKQEINNELQIEDIIVDESGNLISYELNRESIISKLYSDVAVPEDLASMLIFQRETISNNATLSIDYVDIEVSGENKNIYNYIGEGVYSDSESKKNVKISGSLQFNPDGKVDYMSLDIQDNKQ